MQSSSPMYPYLASATIALMSDVFVCNEACCCHVHQVGSTHVPAPPRPLPPLPMAATVPRDYGMVATLDHGSAIYSVALTSILGPRIVYSTGEIMHNHERVIVWWTSCTLQVRSDQYVLLSYARRLACQRNLTKTMCHFIVSNVKFLYVGVRHFNIRNFIVSNFSIVLSIQLNL